MGLKRRPTGGLCQKKTNAKQRCPVGEGTIARTVSLVRQHESVALAVDMAGKEQRGRTEEGRVGGRKEGRKEGKGKERKAVPSRPQARREGNGKPLLTHFI